jgi:hypothetical protein
VWLAEERTQVVGTFPPKRKKGWTGLVEKDTAGQTNIYSVEASTAAIPTRRDLVWLDARAGPLLFFERDKVVTTNGS